MKKTLLASALLLAFSATALAASHDFKGVNGTVSNGECIGNKIVGGWTADENGTFVNLKTPINTSVVIDSTGKYDDIVGGNVSKTTKKNSAVQIESTSVVIKNAVASESVIGGSRYSDGEGSIITGSTSLEISGGTICTGPNTEQILTGLVFAGDLIKLDKGEGNGKADGQSKIGTANLTISGGTFDALVFGGSGVQDWYENTGGHLSGKPGAYMTAEVGTANMVITGGTFMHNIYGGGYAMAWNGQKSTSSVNELNMTIEGPDVNILGDVYFGGLEEERTNGISVGKAKVSISNATIKGSVYGYSGYHRYDGSKHNYSVNLNKPVDTELTITNSQIGSLYLDEGSSVTLRAEGKNGFAKVTNVTGDVTVAFEADGAFNDSIGGDMEKAKEAFVFGDYAIDTVKLEEGDLIGAVTFDEHGNVVKHVNVKTQALAEKVTLAPQMITRIMMNDVRKRMGDIRAAEGTHGVWARYNGGQMAGDGMEADFNMVQVGIDTVPVVDAPRFGVAFSYAQTEADDAYGSSDMDSFSLAFYGTKMYESGMFVDVIGRMATMDTDMVNAGYKGKMDNVALSLSGEFGWRFDVTDRFFIEPSAELTYTYTNADTFSMSNGVTYELEATDSLVGRAGFAAGFKCPANKGDVYVRAAVVHEFMGDLTMNSSKNGIVAAPVESDGEDTYFEYAIGAQFNVNKNTYVYADVERTEGATLDEDWRANAGVRFAF